MRNTREVIIPQGMEIIYEKYHYCPGIKVGNTLYISGQVGRDENLQVVEDITVHSFKNLITTSDTSSGIWFIIQIVPASNSTS